MHNRLTALILPLLLCLPLSLWGKPLLIHGDLDETERAIYLAFALDTPEHVLAYRLDAAQPQRDRENLQRLIAQQGARPLIAVGDAAYAFAARELPAEKLIAIAISFDFARRSSRKEDRVLLRDMPLANKFAILKVLFPQLKTVGLLYNPKEDQENVERLISKTRGASLRLATVKVDDPATLAGQLPVFKGTADLFWLLDSPTLRDPKALDAIRRFCGENNIPLFVADPALVAQGGLISVRSSPAAVGTFAARWVRDTLAGRSVPSVAFPEKAEIVLSASRIVPAGGGAADKLFERFQQLTAAAHTIYLEP